MSVLYRLGALSALLLAVLLPCLAQGPEVPLNFVHAPGPVVIDGKLDDWVLTAPVTYDVDSNASDRKVKTYAMWDEQNLYLAYVVRDASPMKNSGDDPSRAFKTGDSLHFYFSTAQQVAAKQSDGGPEDYHVLMAMLGGKPSIFAFRQKKAGVTQSTQYSSPAQHIDLDWAGPVAGAEMAVVIAPDKAGYTAEVKLPLAFFDNFHPAAGRAVGADVAVNFSDATGTTNLAKVWWHRGASQILDVPTELRFERNRWGTAVFRAAGEMPLVIDNANFYAVPAPGPVTIDGDLSDWDLSTAYGPSYVDPSLKDQYNVTWAAMYDAQYLYLGAIFKSATPLHNAGGVDHVWWQGDSLEFRLNADVKHQSGDPRANMDILTFALWYNDKDDQDYIAMQRSFKFVLGDTSAMAVHSKVIPGGRSFEARIPWAILQNGNAPKAGDAISCTLASIWKNGLRAYGMGSITSFRGMDNWGQAHFLAQGKQKLVSYNLSAPPAVEQPINAGAFKTTVTVPEKGLLSAGVYRDGKLLRTLFAGRKVEAGAVEIGWDGKDDAGQPLPPAQYAVRAVANAGMHAQYITSAATPGNPPCASTDPKRGWGGVWDNVKDIAADATGIYPLWGVEEGDGALLHTDENGQLLWRQHEPLSLPGLHTTLASNGKYVFVGVNVEGPKAGKAGLWRVRCADGGYAPIPHDGSDPLEFYLDGIKREGTAADAPIAGLAADATTLYVAAPFQNMVACFDAESGAPGRTYPVTRPGGLCLDGAGALLVVSEGQIKRLDLNTGNLQAVVHAGLADPWHVATDAQGMIYVTDRGDSQQVKCFDRNGKLQHTFGKPGGRDNNGKYDANRLRNPAGITIAPSGKVFYSEDAQPRTFTRLSHDLKFEQQWAGPWYLSGEVTVDPADPDHLYLWSSQDAFVRYKIDYQAKTSKPDAVWSKFALPSSQFARWFPRIVHHAGKTYMFCAGTNVSLFRIDGDKMLLVAVLGADWRDKVHPCWTFFDLNENGVVDPGEKTFYSPMPAPLPTYRGSYWGGDIDERDMTIYLANGANVLAITPTFVKPGVPVYDYTKARVIPQAAARKIGQNTNLSSIWHMPDGGIVGNAEADGSDPRGIGHSSHLSDVFVYRLDQNGNLLWRAGKKASGIAKNGEFYGRACGLGGPIADKYFDFLDEGGIENIYSLDGLYVGTLLDDQAVATPSAYTLQVEHFGTVVYQNARDKQWYFVAGAGGYASIWRIDGLEKITRLTGEMVVK